MAGATLFRSVQVYDPAGAFHGQTIDLLIEDGLMRINPSGTPAECEVIDVPGLHVSAGWVDFGAAVYEPGHEEKETVDAFLAAAATGGFTQVFAYADTIPSVDSASSARGLLSLVDEGFGVSLHLIAALSRGREGKQLSEIGELATAGVRHFGDGLQSVGDAKLVQLALAYSQAFDAVVVAQPGEARLENNGQMHEGLVSTMLGVSGVPAMAESIGLERELALLGYRGGRLHLPLLTLASSVERVAFAKTVHPGLTYGVSVAHLLLDEGALSNYDVDAKLWPPLRTAADREALCDAVAKRSADVLSSHHRPQDVESKRVEFPYAAFGAATIEHAFGIACTAMGGADDVVHYFAVQNRALAGLPAVGIDDGVPAELTFFLPQQAFVAPDTPLAGGGVNVYAAGRRLIGVPVGTFANGAWRESRWADHLNLKTVS